MRNCRITKMYGDPIPKLRMHYARVSLARSINHNLTAYDANKIALEYMSFLEQMYRDYTIVLHHSPDEDLRSQVAHRLYKTGQWRAFVKNLVYWYRESPNSQRLPQVLYQHASQLDHEMATFKRICLQYERDLWDLPERRRPRFYIRRPDQYHYLPHWDGRRHTISRDERPRPIGSMNRHQ